MKITAETMDEYMVLFIMIRPYQWGGMNIECETCVLDVVKNMQQIQAVVLCSNL